MLKTNHVIILFVIFMMLSCNSSSGQGEKEMQKEERVSLDQIEQKKELTFKSDRCDLGVANVNQKELVGYLEYINETEKDMAFLGVSTNCRCVKVEYDTGIIHPGAEGRIKVIFINDQGPMKFEKKVTARTSSLLKGIEFKIIGEIR